tara:strand:- start:859 stop:1698 length:840 start_codon:yes stop_codon:yes gene_type:complete
MATIDLGKIKLTWKGTYAGGTAYVPDDVVEYTDTGVTSSYICTANSTGNAPSSGGTAHGSWAYMVKGYSTPTTTRGDIIYRGASADARLAKGTQGHVLTMGANDPAWAAAAGGGKVLQVKQNYSNNEWQNATGTTPTNWSALNTSITPTSASSRIIVHLTFGCLQFYQASCLGYGRIVYDKNNGTNWTYDNSNEPYGANTVASGAYMQWAVNLEGSNWEAYPVAFCGIYHPNQTSAVKYGVQFWGESGGAVINVNRNERNNTNDYSAVSTMTLWEVDIS